MSLNKLRLSNWQRDIGTFPFQATRYIHTSVARYFETLAEVDLNYGCWRSTKLIWLILEASLRWGECVDSKSAGYGDFPYHVHRIESTGDHGCQEICFAIQVSGTSAIQEGITLFQLCQKYSLCWCSGFVDFSYTDQSIISGSYPALTFTPPF